MSANQADKLSYIKIPQFPQELLLLNFFILLFIILLEKSKK